MSELDEIVNKILDKIAGSDLGLFSLSLLAPMLIVPVLIVSVGPFAQLDRGRSALLWRTCERRPQLSTWRAKVLCDANPDISCWPPSSELIYCTHDH